MVDVTVVNCEHDRAAGRLIVQESFEQLSEREELVAVSSKVLQCPSEEYRINSVYSAVPVHEAVAHEDRGGAAPDQCEARVHPRHEQGMTIDGANEAHTGDLSVVQSVAVRRATFGFARFSRIVAS